MSAPKKAERALDVSFPGPRGDVRGLWDAVPGASAVAVLAHGAGAGMTHPFMEGVAVGLAGEGVAVLRFDFPYITEGRRSPDRPNVAVATWEAALREAGKHELPVVAGGKSFGGRMASVLAAEQGELFTAAALVFFGYPLHAPGKADQPRDAHLGSITVPMLFIEGTDDRFARFDLIEAVVQRLQPLARMQVIKGGDHSFRVRGARRPDAEIGAELGVVAGSFVREVVV
jgi:predicted alpha/beta-hydrolase family hydrolase